MACQGRMYTLSLFITISTYVVTSQVTDDVFGMTIHNKACYGSGDWCTYNSLQCRNKQVLISSIFAYQGSSIFQGVSSCDKFNSTSNCFYREKTFILDNGMIDNHTLNIYRACSGQEMCEVRVPHIVMDKDILTATKVNYHCIDGSNIINYCEEVNHINTTVHIMYNGQQDNYVNRDCYCSIHADSVIDLYSVDIRLQKQDSASPQCSDTTLKWGYNKTENVEKCIHSYEHSTLRKMTITKDMWVQLSIQDENPTMVWIAAKATSGKVNVRCGQRNVNTQGTTTTLSVMQPTLATTAQLHEPSLNTTVAEIGPHSHNTAPEDETNIGVIVGPVVGTILLVVLVVIGIIFRRRRACEMCSKKKGDTDDQSYENVPPTIQLSGISNGSHAYENTPGTVQHYEQLQPSMDNNEYQSIGTIDRQQLDQDNAAYVNQDENDTKLVLEMSGGDSDRNNEEQNYYSSIQDDNKVSHGADDDEYYNT